MILFRINEHLTLGQGLLYYKIMPRYEWQLVNLKTKAIFPVRKTITTVGRNINADFKLRASVVSRQHAHLVVGEDGGLYVEALEVSR